VFVPYIADAEDVVSDLQRLNITADVVTSLDNKEDRENKLADFKSGKIKVIVNCGTMTTGYDYPELDCIILARKTLSLSLYTQMIGRGVRIAPDKVNCLVIDLVENMPYFGRFEHMQIVGESINSYIKSDIGKITGIPTKIRIAEIYDEKKKKCKKKQREEMETRIRKEPGLVVMPFGKFKGQHIRNVPDEYLSWMNKNIDNYFLCNIKKEINRRAMYDLHVDTSFDSRRFDDGFGVVYGDVIREVAYVCCVVRKKIENEILESMFKGLYPEYEDYNLYEITVDKKQEDKYVYNFRAFN
jgi:superfamily II DNA/RNA helicase